MKSRRVTATEDPNSKLYGTPTMVDILYDSIRFLTIRSC